MVNSCLKSCKTLRIANEDLTITVVSSRGENEAGKLLLMMLIHPIFLETALVSLNEAQKPSIDLQAAQSYWIKNKDFTMVLITESNTANPVRETSV